MKEFKREITQEKIIYEITKEELEEIKKNERSRGRNDIIGYLGFCGENYKLELNIAGCVRFCEEIIDFMLDKKNYISNIYGYSFNDYLKKYRNT